MTHARRPAPALVAALLALALPLAPPSAADVTGSTSDVLPVALTSPAIVWHQFQDRLYVFGGSNDPRVIEIDTHTQTATFKGASFPVGTNGMAAIDFGDFSGPQYVLRVLVAGSTDASHGSKLFRYTPATDSLVASAAQFPEPHAYVAAELGGDGIYLFGGAAGETSDSFDTIHRYTYYDDTLIQKSATLPRPASHIFAAHDSPSGLFYLFHREAVWTYDAAADQVAVLPATNPCGGNGFAGAIEYNWNKVFLLGGTACPTSIVQFDIASQTFTVMAASLPGPSVGVAADLVPSLTGGDDFYYVAGGDSRSLDRYSTVPGAPTNVETARGPFRGQVDVTWDLPAPNTYMWSGSPEILSFEVWRAFSAGGPYELQASQTLSPFHDGGLPDATTVYYRVRAFHFIDGLGAFSDPVAVGTHGPPAQPAAAQAEPGPSGGEVTVSWSPPSDDGGFPLLAYEVTRIDATSGSAEASWWVGPEETTTVDTGLVPVRNVRYEVRAGNELGWSGAATTSTVRVPITCLPLVGCV